jgi:hypothetical protein
MGCPTSAGTLVNAVSSIPWPKDRSLDMLAERGNVAQFISFSLGVHGEIVQHYSRLIDLAPNHKFHTLHNALESLLARSSDGSVNIRSFSPTSPRSREFVYGIGNVEEAVGVANLCWRRSIHNRQRNC